MPDNNKPDTTTIHKVDTVCVQGAGIAEDQNSAWRRTMEDAHVVSDPFDEDPMEGFYAVYDGHGGESAAKFVEQHLHKTFAKEMKLGKQSPQEAYKTTMRLTDEQILQAEIMFTGTTAVCCYLSRKAPHPTDSVTDTTVEDFKGTLYSANVGDARAVMYREGEGAIRLTRDHRIKDAGEAQRVKANGGFIAMNRVNGILAVSRALGDHLLKEVIISEPYIDVRTITSRDKFVVVACDGLWDSICDADVVDEARKLLETHRELPMKERCAAVAGGLVKAALTAGTSDNVSVVFVML